MTTLLRAGLLLLVSTATLVAQPLPTFTPEEAGMDSEILSRTDQLIQAAINEKQTPGAVLMVVRGGTVVWNRSYGHLGSDGKAVTSRTVYDLASLTKPLVTATAVMQLIEQGLIRLSDPVVNFLPNFRPAAPDEKGNTTIIRVIHLLTHTSGMPAYPPVEELLQSTGSDSIRDVLDQWLDGVERDFSAGASFQYSCPNFVTLQRIVEVVTGSDLATYASLNIFEPLGMTQTTYIPPKDWREKTAPTGLMSFGSEQACTVHDPFARDLMGGVSGNAGLFSTAEDLAIFSAMMLHKGEWNGTRILSPASVDRMTQVPEKLESFGRGLGWDLNSAFASNQGDLFGPNTYGHTGYTGTSLIIDPDTQVAVILLTNRVHPEGGGGSVVRLRSQVANIVAASIMHPYPDNQWR